MDRKELREEFIKCVWMSIHMSDQLDGAGCPSVMDMCSELYPCGCQAEDLNIVHFDSVSDS